MQNICKYNILRYMPNSNIFVVWIYSKFEYLFISFLRNILVNSKKPLLSFHLVTEILCAEYFYIFLKNINNASFTGVKTEKTSLYISELKWWKKDTTSLSISTLTVVKNIISRLAKSGPVIGHIPREILRYVLTSCWKVGQ